MIDLSQNFRDNYLDKLDTPFLMISGAQDNLSSNEAQKTLLFDKSKV